MISKQIVLVIPIMMLLFSRYWPYLSKVADNFTDMQPLMEMRPFLSVMHAKAHTAKCEVPEMTVNGVSLI